MNGPKLESETESRTEQPAKASYHPPKLEILGSLRSATRGTGGNGADIGGAMTMTSDRNAKEDIVKVGQHPQLGLGIYAFRYKGPHAKVYGAGRRIGFMADEVEQLYPDAVSRHVDGYLQVDYARLLN